MLARFAEAIRLFGTHFRLLTAIILTVWLPGNALVTYYAYNFEGDSEVGILRLTTWIEGIFGPIYIGGLLYALFEIKSGRTVTYRQAMTIGLKRWGALFGARFAVGFAIVFGLICLVIPGIVVAIRFSLIDAAVVLEGQGVKGSRARSAELTTGRRWPIFWSAVMFFIPFMALSFGIYLPLGFVESLNVMPVEIAIDSFLDLAYAVIQIVMFLFYWEAIQEENRAETSLETAPLPAATEP